MDLDKIIEGFIGLLSIGVAGLVLISIRFPNLSDVATSVFTGLVEFGIYILIVLFIVAATIEAFE